MTHMHIVPARKSITFLEQALLRAQVDGFHGVKGILNQIDNSIADHGPYPSFPQELNSLVNLVKQVNAQNRRDMSARIQANARLILARQRAYAQEDRQHELQVEGYAEDVLQALDKIANR